MIVTPKGEMAEWFKAQHWKCCLGQLNGGSNPPLSVATKVLAVKFSRTLNDFDSILYQKFSVSNPQVNQAQ